MSDRLAGIERHHNCTCEVCWLVAEVERLSASEKTAFLEGYRWGNDEPIGEDECWGKYKAGEKSLETRIQEDKV